MVRRIIRFIHSHYDQHLANILFRHDTCRHHSGRLYAPYQHHTRPRLCAPPLAPLISQFFTNAALIPVRRLERRARGLPNKRRAQRSGACATTQQPSVSPPHHGLWCAIISTLIAACIPWQLRPRCRASARRSLCVRLRVSSPTAVARTSQAQMTRCNVWCTSQGRHGRPTPTR